MKERKDGYKEIARRNIELDVEFLKEVVKHPDILKAISSETYVFLMPKKDRWLREKNFELAMKTINKGEKVVLLPV